MEFVSFEHLVEIFCKMVLVRKCLGWVVGHLLFNSGMVHREEVVVAFWDLHGSRVL